MRCWRCRFETVGWKLHRWFMSKSWHRASTEQMTCDTHGLLTAESFKLEA